MFSIFISLIMKYLLNYILFVFIWASQAIGVPVNGESVAASSNDAVVSTAQPGNDYHISWDKLGPMIPTNSFLGGGAFSEVYAVHWPLASEGATPGVQLLAYKAFSRLDRPDVRLLIDREIAMLRRVGLHSNIVELKGVVRDSQEQIIGILTPHYGTVTLFEVVHNARYSYSLKEIKAWSHGILKGLKHMHEQRVVHRDLKTSNIMFSCHNFSNPVIIDLGFANVYERGRRLTGGRGTVHYMSPENIGHEEYDHREDIYAFGFLLWEMLNRAIPFDAEISTVRNYREMAIAHAVLYSGSRPSLDNVRRYYPTLEGVIEACWAQKQENRPPIERIQEIIERAITPDNEKVKITYP